MLPSPGTSAPLPAVPTGCVPRSTLLHSLALLFGPVCICFGDTCLNTCITSHYKQTLYVRARAPTCVRECTHTNEQENPQLHRWKSSQRFRTLSGYGKRCFLSLVIFLFLILFPWVPQTSPLLSRLCRNNCFTVGVGLGVGGAEFNQIPDFPGGQGKVGRLLEAMQQELVESLGRVLHSRGLLGMGRSSGTGFRGHLSRLGPCPATSWLCGTGQIPCLLWASVS